MIKISVIIPVFNVEKFLPDCLNSILRQTITDIEIICVNDGSTDSSLEILHAYQKRDNRIRVINQSNAGVSEARNRAIESAVGEYIAMVDSDDWIECDMLEKLYKEAKNKDADIVECDLIEHRELKLDAIKYRRLKIKSNFLVKIKINSGKPYNWRDIKSNVLYSRAYVWNKIYRTSLIKDNIIFDGRSGEDYPFVIEAFLKADKIVYLNQPLYHYRKRAFSLSSTDNKKETIQVSADTMYANCGRIGGIIEKCGLKTELKKYFEKYVLQRLWLEYKFITNRICGECKEILGEKDFIKLENLVKNNGKNFAEKLFSISTEMTAGMVFKEVCILGYSFLFKI